MKSLECAFAVTLLASGAAHPSAAGNPETVQTLYAAFGAGDIRNILSALSDDVKWDHGYEGTSVPTMIPRTGPDEVVGFFESLGALEFRKFDVLNMMEGGDQVAVLIDVELVGKSSGKSFADTELHLWRFGDDGKVIAFRHFLGMEEYSQILVE